MRHGEEDQHVKMQGSLEALHLGSGNSRCFTSSQAAGQGEDPFSSRMSAASTQDLSSLCPPEASSLLFATPSVNAVHSSSSSSSSSWTSSCPGEAGKMHSPARKNGDSGQGFSSVWTAFDEDDTLFQQPSSSNPNESFAANAKPSLFLGSSLSPRGAVASDVRLRSPVAAGDTLFPGVLSPRLRSELGREGCAGADSWDPKETPEEAGDRFLKEEDFCPWVDASSSRDRGVDAAAAFPFASPSASSPRELPLPSGSGSPISGVVTSFSDPAGASPAVGISAPSAHADLDIRNSKAEGDSSCTLQARSGSSAASEQGESSTGEPKVGEGGTAPEEGTGEGNAEGRDGIGDGAKHADEESVSPSQCHGLSHPATSCSLSGLPLASASFYPAASSLTAGKAASRGTPSGAKGLLTLPVSPVLFQDEKGYPEGMPNSTFSPSRQESASPQESATGERRESEEGKQLEHEPEEEREGRAREPARGETESPVSSSSPLASAFSPPRTREGEGEEEQDFPIEEGRQTEDVAEKTTGALPSCEGESSVPRGGVLPACPSPPPPPASDAADLSTDPESVSSAPCSPSSSTLSSARRRLDMVDDAEARLMLSTLMHPDDQESRRFLQQVQQNSAAAASSLPQPHADSGRASPSEPSGGFWSAGGWGGRSRDVSVSSSPSVSHAASPPAGASRFLFRALNFGIPGFRSARQEEKGGDEEGGRQSSDGRERPATLSEATTEFERLLEAQQPATRAAPKDPDGLAREAPSRASGISAMERKRVEDGEEPGDTRLDRESNAGGSDLGQKAEKKDGDALPSSLPPPPGSSSTTPRERNAPSAQHSSAMPARHPSSLTPSPSQASASSASFSASLAAPSPTVSGKPRTPYNVFLERLKHPSCSGVVVSVKRFVEMFPTNLSRAEAARRIHPFLSQVQAALLKAEVFAGAKTESERQQVMEGLERFVLQKLHTILFRESPEDRAENEALRRKLHCLSWVEFRHLEVPPLPNASALALGAREIERLDKMRCPRDKLVLILNCCRVIIAVLDSASKAAGSSTPPAADDLLPLLIYTLIQAKPNSLHSHIQFISFFRHPSRLVSEEAYFFTHFCSAVEFVKMLGQPGVTLNDVSDEEYRRRMAQAEAEYDRERERQTAVKKDEGGEQKVEVNNANNLQGSRGPATGNDANERTGNSGAAPFASSAHPSFSQAFSLGTDAKKIETKEQEETGKGKERSREEDFGGVAPAALAAAASALSTLEHLSSSSSPFVRGSYERSEKQREILDLCDDIQRQPLSFQGVSSADLKVGQIPALLKEYNELADLLTRAACLLRDPGVDADAKHSDRK
ncbi:vacuolar sorting protein 9 (vps9) domain-containing protein [Toxoplasma gondii ME49]|uniref:Vacuolar sorting protein 9 (Vps9) domain-containing protein n=2 Tax=Toxoplasma gondii TaxID=5811 RepID=B6KJB2_TOXGV|nr:vacuolar sorting protein 9 (vps9) domain-containing protein [Toxoplasma gondii ME49]EPT29041.1 vacuolar sorting protein 9 (vps9) domain-containing protein [Toxoplasma gondii ME49]ESS35666.1 vacuolar sorting protein 9 (vps9) domain-containing protein [Toxoplasma gondii VEG]CEL74754.1 TPA: vacuolar sorting protein 9 domain-containing protein [Toxoplasma gondii VEG]|eukprot:XP_002367935.1 vacuolar sorting protein 9 (vps9) domain-containing protein [Toxoplasma gondii ME49]